MTNPITPTVGHVVLFRSPDARQTGGAPEVPALVTRVWSDVCVNLMVLRDGHEATPIGVTSVLYDDSDEGPAWNGWRWMPYQKAVAAGEISPTRHA